jgi:hypothetical protein
MFGLRKTHLYFVCIVALAQTHKAQKLYDLREFCAFALLYQPCPGDNIDCVCMCGVLYLHLYLG